MFLFEILERRSTAKNTFLVCFSALKIGSAWNWRKRRYLQSVWRAFSFTKPGNKPLLLLKRNHFTRFFFCRFNLAWVSQQSPGKRSFSDEIWHLDFCVPSSPNSRALFFQTSREVALTLRPWVHIVIDMEIKQCCEHSMATRSFEVQNSSGSRPTLESYAPQQGASWVPPWILLAPDKFPEMSMHTVITRWSLFKKMEKPASSSRVCKFDQMCLNSRPGSFRFKSPNQKAVSARLAMHFEGSFAPDSSLEACTGGPDTTCCEQRNNCDARDHFPAVNSVRWTQPHRFPWHVKRFFRQVCWRRAFWAMRWKDQALF